MFSEMRRKLGSLYRSLSPAHKPGAAASETNREHHPFSTDIDLLSGEVLSNPYPHYAAMLRARSVHFMTRHGFWMVLGYDDVVYALKHPGMFSSVRPSVRFDPFLNEADPPAHTRVRRALTPHFSPRFAQALEAHARTRATELLGRADGAAEFDIVDDFADPLMESAMGRLLGFSEDETGELMRLLAPHKRRMDGEVYRVLEEWLKVQVARRRERPDENPCDESLSGDSALAPEEAVGVLKLLWVAGTTTTSRLISASVMLLLKHPAVEAKLREDASLVPAFIEEAVRLEASEQMVWRFTRECVELSGVSIPAGEEVRLCVAAANRDPKYFEEPDELSLYRSPNNHLSFAAGPHYCLGAAQGRVVARAAIESLLAAWPRFSASRPLSSVSYEASFSSRALEHLYVRRAA